MADDASSIDYSVRVPPSLRVTFRGRDGEVVVERYLGESAEAAVRARMPRRQGVTRRVRRPAERLRVQGDAVRGLRGRPGAQGRGAGAPRGCLRRLSTLAALGGAVAIAYFQHRAAQAGV